jgi:hypothetical protein
MLSAVLFHAIRPEFLRLPGSAGVRVYVDPAEALETESGLRSGALEREEALGIVERVVERHAEVELEEAGEHRATAQRFFERLNETFSGRCVTDAEAGIGERPVLLVGEVKLLGGLESRYTPRLRQVLGEVETLDDETFDEEFGPRGAALS